MGNNDYFAKLVSEARQRAAKAMIKFPQPNYVLNKVAEEHGEVIKGVIHYLEGRETWQNVENELIDNLAMLIRLVTEGDQVIGFTPPRSCFVGLPVDTASTMTFPEWCEQNDRKPVGWVREALEEAFNAGRNAGISIGTLSKAMQNAPLSTSDNQGKPLAWENCRQAVINIDPAKGYALMPLDPTPEMLEEICLTEGFTEKALRARYAALIAAGQKVVQDVD